MPGYVNVHPDLWDGRTGRRLDTGWSKHPPGEKRDKARQVAQWAIILRDYLVTNRLARATMWGLYRLPFSTVCDDLQCLTPEEIRAAFKRLSDPDIDFVVYDEIERSVWVKNFLRYQFPRGLRPSEGKRDDGRYMSLVRDLCNLRKLKFFEEWYEAYREYCSLPPIEKIAEPPRKRSKTPPREALGDEPKQPALPGVPVDQAEPAEDPDDDDADGEEDQPDDEEEQPDADDPLLVQYDVKGNIVLTPNLLAKGWNDVCGVAGFPQVRIPISPDRQRHAKARIEDKPDPLLWGQVFERIKASGFLGGRNDRGWKADFDWLIRPGSADRVLEGKYDNRRPEGPQMGAAR